MAGGLATTFRILSATNNESAVRVLVAALDSPDRAVQEGAIEAIIARRGVEGQREILRRLHLANERWKRLLRRHPGAMTRTLRNGILGNDSHLYANACRAAVWFREYELIPALLTRLEGKETLDADLASATMLQLVARLCRELAAPQEYKGARSPQFIRCNVVSGLERSVERFARHGRRAVIEAFLDLVERENATLQSILRDPKHPTYATLVDVLSTSRQGGVIRLLLSYVDDRHAPDKAISVAVDRTDLKFLNRFLHKIGREPSAAAKDHLKRIKSVDWLPEGQQILEKLDDEAQQGVIRLVLTSAIPRKQAYVAVEHLLLHGKVGGRRAAAEALAHFTGVRANGLAVQALDDGDPEVRASIVRQLRHRGIPTILTRLIELVDDPHEVVRQAARESLDEFTFERFLGAFDMLDEEVRVSTGSLVKKVDLNTLDRLQEELESPARTRRLRGLAMTQALNAISEMELVVADMLHDEDPVVRSEAATCLAGTNTPASLQALGMATKDRHAAVREAARHSLGHLGEPT